MTNEQKREEKLKAREDRKSDRTDRRERYLRLASEDRDFRLANDVPHREDDCKGAWVEQKQRDKFLNMGWEDILDPNGKQVITEVPTRTGGMEVFFGMQIPLDWYLEKEQISEQKRKQLESASNKGVDEHSQAGKDGFWSLKEHKTEVKKL